MPPMRYGEAPKSGCTFRIGFFVTMEKRRRRADSISTHSI
jgi:hypothetical protein